MVVSQDGKTLYHIQNAHSEEGDGSPYDMFIWSRHSPTHAQLVKLVKQEVYDGEGDYDRIEDFVDDCTVYPVFEAELEQIPLTPQEERELALSEAQNGWSDICQVECDDTGDKWWKWHAKYFIHSKLAWENYYHNEPSSERVYNDLLDSIKEDPDLAHHIAGIVNNS